ncbi:MAG: hypothetical protein GF341_10660 [candidate division Zixibacteria bacterium]|nr:hypothetical protein [candidate division Zixibacteria bacterium]
MGYQDVVVFIDYLFHNGDPLVADSLCLSEDRGDVDCSGSSTVADVVLLIEWFFQTGVSACDPCESGLSTPSPTSDSLAVSDGSP